MPAKVKEPFHLSIHEKMAERNRVMWDKRHAEKRRLLEEAKIAQKLTDHYENNKFLYYRPCCRVHEKCSTILCPDSVHGKFHASDRKVRLFLGGNRSGKTTAGVMELIARTCCKVNPFTKEVNRFPNYSRIFCSDFSLIEKNILPKIFEWIPKDSLLNGKAFSTKQEAWENAYDRQFRILRLNSGGHYDFMSYDQDLSKTESVELDNVWADEEMPERFYTSSMARLVSRGGRFWMTVTPLYSLTWAMAFLDGGDSDVETFVVDIRDNPHNNVTEIESFIKKIEMMAPNEVEARIHGRFLELQGLVYKELRRDVHWVDASKLEPGYPVYFAMDPHPRKPTVMIWGFVTPKEDVVVFDELEMGGTASDIATAIRDKERQHGVPTTFRVIDPAAKGQGSNLAFQTDTLQEFEKEGLSFALADNSEAGYNVVHEYLSWDKERPMSSTNRPRLFFTKDCPKTWQGMTHLLWDEYRTNNLRDPKERVKDYRKDFPDCVRYLIAGRPRYHLALSPVTLKKVHSKKDLYQPSRPVHEWRRRGIVATKLEVVPVGGIPA